MSFSLVLSAFKAVHFAVELARIVNVFARFFPDVFFDNPRCNDVQLITGILVQHQLALFAGYYKQLFLATTLVGLYRLLFQVKYG